MMGQPSSAEEGAGLSAADEAAIRALVSAYETVWNASDMDGMGKLYTANVHWVNVKGMHWRGFEEVDRAHRVFFDIMFRGVPSTLNEIESITSVAPGVAIAVVAWNMGVFRTPDGLQAPAAVNRMTMVLRKQPDGWKIAHGANIIVDAQAAPNDPIRGSRRPPSQ